MAKRNDKIVKVEIKEKWHDVLLKWVGVVAIIVSICALGFSMYTFNYSKYADLQLSNIPEDLVPIYQLENVLNNLYDREIEINLRNVGGLESGEISLSSVDEDIFQQSYSTNLGNIAPGKNNHTTLKFSFDFHQLEEIPSTKNLFYLTIRVRCDNCKTEIKYVPICIWQEDYSECKDNYPVVGQ